MLRKLIIILFDKYSSSNYIKSVVKVISGNLSTNFISLITSVLVARWTNPYDMGLWNIALLVTVYAPTLQLGVLNGLNRELPYYIGTGDKEKSLNMARVSYAWCLILTVISVVVAISFVLWFWYQGQSKNCYTSMAIGILVVCSWLSMYLTTTYRTFSEFGRLAKNTTLVALVGVALTLFVWMFSYIGLLIRASLLAILGVVAFYYKRPLAVKPHWDKTILIHLARIGLPIWFLGQLGTLFMTLDRLVLAGSPQILGYFTIAMQVGAFAGLIPIAFTMVLYPQMAHKYGETHSAMEIWCIAKKGAIAASALGAVAGFLGWILIPSFVNILLPKYIPGITAAQWAAFIGLSTGLSVFNNVYNVIRRQDVYLVTIVIGLAVFWGMWFFLTRSLGHPEIVSAVQAMLMATFVMSLSSAIISKVTCRNHDICSSSASKDSLT